MCLLKTVACRGTFQVSFGKVPVHPSLVYKEQKSIITNSQMLFCSLRHERNCTENSSGEKMTLTISVLLSIVVFLLLVSKILPPTSSTIPLMAKYLLLTFVLNVITILVTVIIINVYFRGPTTHRMPKWVRIVFLQVSLCKDLVTSQGSLFPNSNGCGFNKRSSKNLVEFKIN